MAQICPTGKTCARPAAGSNSWKQVATVEPGTLGSGFSAVVFLAEHLAVCGIGFASGVPRRNVIRLHFRYCEHVSTHWAYAILAFKRLDAVLFSEFANVQMPFLTIKDIAVDSGFIRNIIIDQKLFDTFLCFVRVKDG